MKIIAMGRNIQSTLYLHLGYLSAARYNQLNVEFEKTSILNSSAIFFEIFMLIVILSLWSRAARLKQSGAEWLMKLSFRLLIITLAVTIFYSIYSYNYYHNELKIEEKIMHDPVQN